MVGMNRAGGQLGPLLFIRLIVHTPAAAVVASGHRTSSSQLDDAVTLIDSLWL